MASLKDQYKNQKDRIRKAYKDILKSGATFDRKFEEIVGVRPKKITQASVNKLKKITKDELWRMAKKDGGSAWKERMKRREDASRKGGKAAQAKKPKKPVEPKEPVEPKPIEPIGGDIGFDDGSMFYENLKGILQENISRKPLLNELLDLLEKVHEELDPDDFAKWADENGDQLVVIIGTEIRYYFVQSIRDECHKKAKAIFKDALKKSSDDSDLPTYTDESGETWMDTSVLDDDEEAFMNW